MMVDWKSSTAVGHSLPPTSDGHHSSNYQSPPQYHFRPLPPPPPPRPLNAQQSLPPNSAPIVHPHLPPHPPPPPPPPGRFSGRPPPYEENPYPSAPADVVKKNNSPPQYGPRPEPRHESPDHRHEPKRRRSSTSRPQVDDGSSLTRARSYANGGSPTEPEPSPRQPPSGEPHPGRRDMEYHQTYGPPLIDRMREHYGHMAPPGPHAPHAHPLPPHHLDTSVGPSSGPHSHPQSAPPYGAQPYSYGYDTPGGMDSSQKRKAVRASQACDNCRSKKAKCDENRPCGNCANQNIVCNFRDMPAPKQERSMMQLSDQVNTLGARMQSIETLLQKIASNVDSDISSPSGDRVSRDRFMTPDGYTASHAASAVSNNPSSQSYSYRTVDNRPHVPNVTSPQWEQQESSQGNMDYMANGQSRMSGPPPPNRPEDDENPPQCDENLESDLSREVARRGQIAHEDMLSKDYLNGKVALAPRHQTAANHLIDWPTIATFFGDIADRNYVKRGEFYHGLDLRQRPRRFDRAMSTPGGSPMGTGENDDASTISNTSDGRPAMAFVRQGAEGSRGMNYTPGGRNPRDQSLSIDNETSFRLLNSYFKHIHILQPFLNKERARSLVQEFVNSYYFEPTFTSSPMEHSTSHGSNGASKRRKYNHGLSSQNRSPGGKVPIARTVENALVLLIFALGKVCEHEGPLPPLIGEQKLIPEGTAVPEGVICTPSKAYPGMVETRHSLFPEEASARADQQGNDPYSSDIDRIPGLAYYVHAAQILGEMHGDNSLTQVHALLLAGLYLGQLLRVNESWKWINGACNAWQMLFKQRDEILGNLADDERAAFWACLMLESDILAEHDCIPSGISKWEDAFTANDDTLLKMDISNPAEEDRYCFFVQGIIRSILNRAHSALYVDSEDKEERSEWQKLSSDDYMKQLERWRANLPDYLAWGNFEAPATYVNRARLRGKYWGARYVIYRPYLRHTLDPAFQNTELYDDAEHHAHFTEKKNVLDNAHSCLEAAKKSTVAFDALPGMRKRLIVTNPFGTAQAQFSNVMVMSAAYCASHLGGFITLEDLLFFIDRTREFISYLAPLSPTMSTDIRILDNTRKIVIVKEKPNLDDTNGILHSAPNSANNSFYTPAHPI